VRSAPCGTVLTVRLDDLPGWLPAWCLDRWGGEPVGSLSVHAEEFRPGGQVLHGDSPEAAVRRAEVFAWLMTELAGVTVPPPLPNPPWVRWDHVDAGVWPAIDVLDRRDQSAVPPVTGGA
jgi:hypothetical protein